MPYLCGHALFKSILFSLSGSADPFDADIFLDPHYIPPYLVHYNQDRKGVPESHRLVVSDDHRQDGQDHIADVRVRDAHIVHAKGNRDKPDLHGDAMHILVHCDDTDPYHVQNIPRKGQEAGGFSREINPDRR